MSTTRAEMAIYFTYLDKLRESGAINTWGATPHLQKQFGIVDRKRAADIHKHWMATFNNAQTAAERAAQVTS